MEISEEQLRQMLQAEYDRGIRMGVEMAQSMKTDSEVKLEERRRLDRERKAGKRKKEAESDSESADFRRLPQTSAEIEGKVSPPSPSLLSRPPSPSTPSSSSLPIIPPSPTPSNGFSEGKVDPKRYPTTPQSIRFHRLMHRRDKTPWQDDEIKAYRKLETVPDEDLSAVEKYYGDHWPPGKDGNLLRRDMLTLLNKWSGEVTRARNYVDHGIVPWENRRIKKVNGNHSHTQPDYSSEYENIVLNHL